MKHTVPARAAIALVLVLLAGCADPRAQAPAASSTPTPDATAGIVGTPAPASTPTATPSPTASPPATLSAPPSSSARALIEAAERGDLPAVRAQIAGGADVDARDGAGRTALFLAAQRGHLEITRALLTAGADVNIADHAADTPYYAAALARHAELTGVLLDAGANRVGTRAYGGTPLIAISERGWVDVARAILARPDIPVDHVNNLGWTALIEAIILGRGGPDHQEIVRMLLAYGANPNIADGQGRSPLTLARERGYTEMVRMLETAGAR
jgi:ankyrin repeat protein